MYALHEDRDGYMVTIGKWESEGDHSCPLFGVAGKGEMGGQRKRNRGPHRRGTKVQGKEARIQNARDRRK